MFEFLINVKSKWIFIINIVDSVVVFEKIIPNLYIITVGFCILQELFAHE